MTLNLGDPNLEIYGHTINNIVRFLKMFFCLLAGFNFKEGP